MLALVYLATSVVLGDRLCRPFYRFASLPHRCATALITGLLVSSWITYLVALAFTKASLPLFWGNLFFFAVAIALFSWSKWKKKIIKGVPTKPKDWASGDIYLTRPAGCDGADWLLIGAYCAFACWLMFASLSSNARQLLIANNEYSDFGPNTAIMQSFAVGHNFPTEYPHFSGDRIRYHFLFYFQGGNLEFLGLDPAWGLNLLSISTLVAMLVLVMTLGEVLFQSRAVARLGSALFFFFGYLSYIPFFYKQNSLGNAIHAITTRRDFLPSIFPYRGELWGTWSQVTFVNQRHFASAIGILLLVLIFLVTQYRALSPRQPKLRSSTDRGATEPSEPSEVSPAALSDDLTPAESLPASEGRTVTAQPPAEEQQPTVLPTESFWTKAPSFIFSGTLLGLLPMWNSAVFISAAAVLGVLFILFPLRLQMLALAVPAGLIALPQMLYLSAGSGRVPMPPLIHWGYTIDHPTFANVAGYLGFTFGVKWLLIGLALVFATSLQRRFFLAISALIAVAFCFQLTVEVLANQKFLHIWVIVANLFVAYGVWSLWRQSLAETTLPTRLVAIVLLILIIPGAIIDLFPIHNGYWNQLPLRNDQLIEWLTKETKPRDIFLTDRFVTHPILMAGRRVFYGWPYYAWGAGYDATQRDRVYQELFENKDPAKVFQLLKDNGIAYVAFDNAVRHGSFIKRPNEQIYAQYFPKVFEDKENRYNSLTIYKVPEKSPPELKSLPQVAASMFEGGLGTGNGQFDSPHGIAADSAGNIFISDTNNGRIEKFSPTGAFIASIGTKGTGYGQLGDPNGIAVDRAGNIYVAEALNHRIQKLTPDGSFVAEWKGPDPGFYGPRKIAIGPDQSLYVVDQGRTRIVRFDQNFKALATWGEKGRGEGQFDDPTSVAVDPASSKVYVADPRNQRIQIFDANGKFLAGWPVPEWGRPYGFEDVVVDPSTGRLYASSANMDSVLVFDLAGARIGSLRPQLPDKLEGPCALVLLNKKFYVLCASSNRVVQIDLQ